MTTDRYIGDRSCPRFRDDTPNSTTATTVDERMPHGPKISVVIPVYRSRDTIARLLEHIGNVMDAQAVEYEIILVDDGSPDGTWEVMQELQERRPAVITAVRLMRNFGQHNALMCGFRQAKGEVIVTMDDDLQNPPEEIPNLFTALRQGEYDLVYGVPQRKQHHFGRNIGSRLVNVFFQLVFRTHVTVTSFRAIRRELLDAILSYDLNYTFVDGLLAWNTKRVGEVAVVHHPRTNGRSGYSLAKLLTLAFNLFTNFSLLPLQIASVVGITASIIGLFVGAYYLLQALFSNIAVPGFASIIVAVMTLGGLQLLALGIIGEYIGRMHLNVNRKPQYTVRTIMRSRKSHLPSEEQLHTSKG